jgi:hypothetical protein
VQEDRREGAVTEGQAFTTDHHTHTNRPKIGLMTDEFSLMHVMRDVIRFTHLPPSLLCSIVPACNKIISPFT